MAEWISTFQEKLNDQQFLKEMIGLPCWIHLSQARLNNLLTQVDHLQKTNGALKNAWPRVVSRYQNTDRADAIYTVIEYGLSNEDIFPEVLDLIIYLITIPSIRMYLEPLLDETLFMIKCPENPKLNLLEYYLSFRYKIEKGTLSWDESQIEYNNTVIHFQSFLFEELTKIGSFSQLINATIKDLNDPVFLQEQLLALDPTVFSHLKEEFGIRESEDPITSASAFVRLLSSPTNIAESIPKYIMPNHLPPDDIIYPHFDAHASCLSDAVLQVFQEKRVNTARYIMSYLEKVCNDLDPSNEERFNINALPVSSISIASSPVGYSSGTCYLVTFDPLFLNFGFSGFKPGDFGYLANVEHREFIGIEVMSTPAEGRIIAHLETNGIPNETFNICIKLPHELAQDVVRIKELPKVIESPRIRQSVVNSFIGFASKEKPSITVVNSLIGSNDSIDAAEWLNSYQKRKRTLVMGISSKVIDSFVLALTSKLVIPQMQILRLDLPSDICIDIVLRSRSKLLQDVLRIEPDPTISSSCAVAENYLRLTHPDQVELIEQLSLLRPLEYIQSNEKRIEYLRKVQADIVCHLIDQPLQIKGQNFENLIILDTCVIEDSDLLKILNESNPNNVRIYGNGQSIKRLRKQPNDVIFHEEINVPSQKPLQIAQFLGVNTLNPGQVIPGVISTFHLWKIYLENAFDAVIASAFYFMMIGYDSLLLVVNNEEEINTIDIEIRKYAAWNDKEFMKLIDDICTPFDIISKGLTADIILYLCNDGDDVDLLKYIANAADKVCWMFGPMFDESNAVIALGERNGVQINGNRYEYVIEGIDHLMALVYNMQCQICTD
ncbi:hypothetical protein GPJ56_010516 [Histomonas meleagridis]|uniref:uncharacterized protein n=1 Tax=Histomonas meleagridis TaxID=135588 RepID=UPI003559B8BE|nr:hypothetical protein GPJ56_010516 [Histomonas meleagridis]KAH0799816.1 hypothetical protein GO595_007387 [Histomonas meleagridis]